MRTRTTAGVYRIHGLAAIAALGLGLGVGCALPGSADADDDPPPAAAGSPGCRAGRFECGARLISRHAQEDVGFEPADLQSMYAIDPARGDGLTIAVVDAYGYTALAKDLAVYRAAFGLPACTVANGCLTIVNDHGATAPLPEPGAGSDGEGWAGETALDVDMVSAVCPRCKILVVQGDVDNDDDALYEAQNAAVMLGATSISNSWSGPEYDGLAADDAAYFDHPGVGIYACTGDYGYDMEGDPDLAGPQFPATSLHVVGVGGTHVVASSNTRGWAETAWTSAGSSCSTHVAKPGYQPADSGCAFRAASDVSAIADLDTGVAIYNAALGGWLEYGGTSVATPAVTALMAAAGHGDATPDFFYAHADVFHDVMTGKNGSCGTKVCDAAAGWDGPTGVGTPSQAKIAAIAATGSGSGSGSDAGSGSGAGSADAGVAITSPADGATVAPGFAILATAAAATSVHLAIDGGEVAVLTKAPYQFTAPAALADGMHELVVSADDGSGGQTTATITVTVASAGGDAADSGAGGCAAGGGVGPAGTLGLGLALAALARRRRRS